MTRLERLERRRRRGRLRFPRRPRDVSSPWRRQVECVNMGICGEVHLVWNVNAETGERRLDDMVMI